MAEPSSVSESNLLIPIGSILKNRWQVTKLLNEGGFGQIYIGKDITNRDEIVAIKAESTSVSIPLLKMEVTVIRRLQKKNHSIKFYGCGRGVIFNYLVMDLVGKNLMELKKSTPADRFSIQTSSRLAIQMIKGLQGLHEVGFIHRDIKPANFAIGLQKKQEHRKVFILDFGLCRQYRNDKGQVRDPRTKCGFRGTVRYASLNIHKNLDMGRLDDLWSVFYIVVEMIVGQLPWRKLTEKEQVRQSKEEIDHFALIKECPPEMKLFLDELSLLNYYSEPDYKMIINCFEAILTRLNCDPNGKFDWEEKSPKDDQMTKLSSISRLPVFFGSRDMHGLEKSFSNDNTGRDAEQIQTRNEDVRDKVIE